MAGIFIREWVYKEPDKSVGNRSTDIIISAGQLVKAFEEDENSANAKYLNKIIEVTGIIKSITENDKEICVVIKDDNATAGVSCSFDLSTIEKSNFVPGKSIIVKGICNGFLMDVVLNKCVVIK